MSSPTEVAVRVGAEHGYSATRPILLQETNHTIVWLRPHAVIAKVGTRSHSTEALTLEHAVATAIASEGAPIAPPIENVPPVLDEQSRLLVTLWHRLEHDDRQVSPEDTAHALETLHHHLADYPDAVPSFTKKLGRAGRLLGDDHSMAALPAQDRSMLRAAFDHYRAEVDAFDFAERTLHGEPHSGNMLTTPEGLRWIDLEAVCTGPLEWDLAYLPEDAASLFPSVDPGLLELLQILISAQVATWCWSRPEHPEMRWHAEHHLERVKGAVQSSS